MGSEAAGLEEAAGDVVGEVPEPQGGTAEVFEAAVQGFGRDAASLQRDGQPFYEMNHLDTADGRPLAEVLFGDGTWLLVDPTKDLQNR